MAKKCDKCIALFYSPSLFEEHSERHSPNKIIKQISVPEITDEEEKDVYIDESYQTDEGKKELECIELI